MAKSTFGHDCYGSAPITLAPRNVTVTGRYFAQGKIPAFFLIFTDKNSPLKILLQIQQTAVQSQRALSVTRGQASAKERERRILQLTIDEIRSIEGNVNMYKGVGKM